MIRRKRKSVKRKVTKTRQSGYENPLWKSKREEIFKRDNYTCQDCGATGVELHCHHKRYFRGKELWETENSYLVTLCVSCHSKRHNRNLSRNLKTKKPQ